MYLTHFGLQEKPFKTGPDPRYIWLGMKHRDALATLVRNVLDANGFEVVTGDLGTGKTTVANALLAELRDRAVAAKVTCSDFEGVDFLKLISKAYGIGAGLHNKEAFHDHFSAFLRNSFSSGKKVVLIIDEAQRLTPEYLSELFHLSDIHENGTQLLSIVFMGQNELRDLLVKESSGAPGRQATFSYELEPLTRDETAQYIAYRLNIAHCERELFTPEAVGEIFSYSKGVPRLINMVCDLSLSRAFFKGQDTVRPETVKECEKMLRVPEEKAAPGKGRPAEARGKEEPRVSEPDKEIHDEVGATITEISKQKPRWVRAAYAAGIVFLVVSVGITLFLVPGNPPEPAKMEAKKEAVPPASSTGGEATVPAAQAGQGSEPSAQLKATDVTGVDSKIQGPGTKKRETAGSRRSGEQARQAQSERLRRNREAPARETPAEDTGRGTSTVSGEPASPGTQDVESGKVIDFLIKKRSEQK